VLVAERETAEFFEAVARGRDARQAANWVINELLGALNRSGRGIGESPVTAGQLGELLDLQREGAISGKIAKEVFDVVFAEGGSPRAIVEDRGLRQVTDTGAIEAVVDEIIAANPDKVEQARAKPALIGWFVGQAMKASGGKANPQTVNALLKAKLGLD
jgi:aspartyl-tRNA(Asn)/glutamyl-tRNA(Gln) amidotransferase subunit B